MGPTGEKHRVFQVHTTRRCNLACLHCYSESGPGAREELSYDVLAAALAGAAAEGYTVAGFSGGEPFLYPLLPQALQVARACGMTTTVTTNGMFLRSSKLAPLAEHVSLLAVSLDGVPQSHDRMRGSTRAFASMAAGLDALRASQIPFGFIFTLTQHNLHELIWVAEFAVEQGAGLLQIHPLAQVGRAQATLPDSSPDGREAAVAYLQAIEVQAHFGGQILVQLDVFDRDLLRANPDRVFAERPRPEPLGRPLADLVSPLVLRTDGVVVPLEYGFPASYALGSLSDGQLEVLGDRWRRGGYPRFREVTERLFDSLASAQGLPFFDWYELVSSQARAADMPLAAAPTS
jgi:Fe-coproporphyrin III synthase